MNHIAFANSDVTKKKEMNIQCQSYEYLIDGIWYHNTYYINI